MLKRFLNKLNCFLLIWLKVENKVRPSFVKSTHNYVSIISTESGRQIIEQSSLDELSLEQMDKVNKKKLGVAIGKAIADDLVISFDPIIKDGPE